MLVVLGGLPGSGKTTIARALALRLGAIHLRIDRIEQALRSSGTLKADVGPAGYLVAYGLAEDNLRLCRVVVADTVTPGSSGPPIPPYGRLIRNSYPPFSCGTVPGADANTRLSPS